MDGSEYADKLGLEGERVTTEEGRLRLLRSLEHGAGVEIISGPMGAAFWSLASPEVKVRIEPDGTEYKERVTDVRAWGFRAAGLSPRDSTTMASRPSPPTERHALYGAYRKGRRFSDDYSKVVNVEPLIVTEFDVKVIHGEANQIQFLDGISEFVSLDWEWNEDTAEPIGLSVSNAERNWYLPVRYKGYAGSHGQSLREACARVLDRGNPVVFHQAKADLQTQYPGDLLDLVGKPIDDTIVMAYLAGEAELGLKPLTEKLLGRGPTPYPGPLDNVPLAMASRYACADTRNTYDLYQSLRRSLREHNQLPPYEDVERTLVPVIGAMEQTGSPIDLDEVRRLQREYAYTEEGIRSFAWQRWRKDISNDKQTRLLVTELLGYDPGTLDQRVLSLVQAPWMDVILGYRKLRTVRRNYLDKYLKNEDKGGVSNVLRASFNQAGSSDTLTGRSFKRAPRTGRLSSARPNLMQVPRDVRSMFVAPEGCVYWALDFSQLELRIAAGLSEDPAMLAEINKPGGDIHRLMQERVQQELGIWIERPVAKNANFNLRYGGSADMMVTILAKDRVFLDPAIAKQIVEIDKELYSGYWEWYDRTLRLARVRGYSSTLYGRRVYYEDLTSSDNYLRGHAERAAVNLAVQGSASDIVKKAMVQSVPPLKHYGAHISIQVHDELAGFCPERNAEKFLDGMKTIMESIEVPHVSLAVEGGYGKNWDEAKH